MLPIEVRPELSTYDRRVLRACGVRVDDQQETSGGQEEVERVVVFGTVRYLALIMGLGGLTLTVIGLLVLAGWKVMR